MNENEKGLIILTTLGAILLGIFAPLIAWFVGAKDSQGNLKEITRNMLNFEITLLIVSLLSLIPLVGLIVGLVVFVGNIAVSVLSFSAANKGNVFKAPCFEFIK